MSTRYQHPSYDPPGFNEHMAMHREYHDYPVDITWGNDRIESCSVCDPRIAAMRYAHNEAVKRDEIEAPLLARINAIRFELNSWLHDTDCSPEETPPHCVCGKLRLLAVLDD